MKSKTYEPKINVPTDKNKEALSEAVNIFGSNMDFIKAINITEATFYRWKQGKRWMSYKLAFKIERITNGQVKAVDLLPK